MNIDYKQKLSENFTLEEFCKSTVAKKNGIKNEPTALAIMHMKDLCIKVLQPFRDYYKKPIIVTSGFRTYALNKLVGGVSSSVHPLGWAADLKPKTGSIEDFASEFKKFLQENNINIDQMCFEHSKKDTWVHVGLYNSGGRQRNMYLDIEVKEKEPDEKNKEGK